MVCALRGAPMTILVLMMIEHQPLAMQYIRRHTRYSQHVVSESLALLNDYGLVVETGRYVYQIADGVRQLPLAVNGLYDSIEDDKSQEMPPDIEEEAFEVESEENRSQKMRARSQKMLPKSEKQPPVVIDSEFRSQKMRPKSQKDIPKPIRSHFLRASSQKMRPKCENSLARSINQNQLINQDLKTLARGEKKSILDCLKRHGIREPACSRLAALEHVTAELVAYHCQHAPNLRLAIFRIEHNWAMLDDAPKADDESRSRKYLNPKYAEFIIH